MIYSPSNILVSVIDNCTDNRRGYRNYESRRNLVLKGGHVVCQASSAGTLVKLLTMLIVIGTREETRIAAVRGTERLLIA